MFILNAHTIRRKCIPAAGQKAKVRKRRETERAREKGKQPVTESGTLSSMETRKDIHIDRHTGSAHRGRELDQTGGDREKTMQGMERERQKLISTHLQLYTRIDIHTCNYTCVCVCVCSTHSDQKVMLVNDLIGSPFYIPTEFGSIYGVWT